MIRPSISGSSLVSRHLSHSCCNKFQLSITLCREPPRTVHLVGHSILKPGNSRAILIFWSMLPVLVKIRSSIERIFKVFDFLSHITNIQLQRMPIAITKKDSRLFGFDLSCLPRVCSRHFWESSSYELTRPEYMLSKYQRKCLVPWTLHVDSNRHPPFSSTRHTLPDLIYLWLHLPW